MTEPQELHQRPSVLLVEDDAENWRLLREILEAEGLSVIGEAGDGAAAVQMTIDALTSHEGPLLERSAGDAGAYAYLLKDCGPWVVVDAVVDAWRHQCGLDQHDGVGADQPSAVADR
jgi:DNA-binding NarL/FixJ family response regulator